MSRSTVPATTRRLLETPLVFSFTLYPACSEVGRESLVLIHSTPYFSAEFWRHCVLNGGTKCHVLPPDQTRAKKRK